MTGPVEHREACAAAASRHGVVADVHPEDFIFRFLIENPVFRSERDAIRYYFDDGARSAARLGSLLADVCALGDRSVELLEFASGFGCVTRHLRRALPRVATTSCDIHSEAIRFLRETLGVAALQSTSVPEDLRSPTRFDVVFALSFFSHMPERTFGRWLRALAALVKPGGFLAFTAHGRVSRDEHLSQCHPDADGYFFHPASEQKDLDVAEDGTTISLPRWVLARAFEVPTLRLRHFREGVWWEHQDLYVFRVVG